MMRKPGRPTVIAVDMDGTLTTSPSWVPPDKMELRDGAREAMWKLKELGYYILIHTARFDAKYFSQSEVDEEIEVITNFLNKNSVPFDELHISPGKPVCEAFICDKAIYFDGSWDNTLLELGRRLNVNIW